MKLAGKSILFLLLTLITAEGLLRLQMFFKDPTTRYVDLVARQAGDLIFQVVNNPDQIPFFQPPFKTFSNVDFKNEERLKMIYQETLGPVGTSALVTDVLDPSSDQKFKITLNSQGFRGKERLPSDSRKIFVLGSYTSFGIGVNDEETFAEKLETMLNANDPEVPVEVWNAGRFSASAIVGLAHLKHNILPRKPDLVILDYGTVDCHLNSSLLFASDTKSDKALLKNVHQLLSYSYLWQNLRTHLWPADKRFIPEFFATMDEILGLLQKNEVPVIVMRSYSTCPELDPYFKNISERELPYFDVVKYLRRFPASKDAWEKIHWLKDVPLDIRMKIPPFSTAPYQKNFIQLNAEGYELVARGLAEIIQGRNLL